MSKTNQKCLHANHVQNGGKVDGAREHSYYALLGAPQRQLNFVGYGEVGRRLSLVLRIHICRRGEEWQDYSFASMAGCFELRWVREHLVIICYGAHIYNVFIKRSNDINTICFID